MCVYVCDRLCDSDSAFLFEESRTMMQLLLPILPPTLLLVTRHSCLPHTPTPTPLEVGQQDGAVGGGGGRGGLKEVNDG